MADINNIDEYRASVLSALGIEDDVNIRYFADYRKALLTKLGMTFTDEDVRNEERFRLKFLEGVSAFSGLSVKTVSGAVVSFNDAVYDVPLKSLLVNFGYKASGYEGVNVTRCGFNIWDEEWQLGYINPSTGIYQARSDRICAKNYLAVKPNTAYYFKDPSPTYMTAVWYDENQARIRNNSPHNEVITSPSNARYLRFSMPSEYGTTYLNDVCVNVSETSKNGTYEPYQGTSYPISLGQTVYGGTLEVMSGKLISTLASDGTELLVPLEIQLPESQVQIIRTLLDHNNIWADIGGVEVKYLAK